MTESTVGRLQIIIDGLASRMPRGFSGCVVTNERGLVIAETMHEGSSSHEFAAMISLLSDTASRINRNLGFSSTESATIRTTNKTMCMQEFLVQKRRFRIGAIVGKNPERRFSFLKRRGSIEALESVLGKTAEEVRQVLEHRRE